MADRKPGFPCRVSLVDAEIGESVLLVNYEHLPAASPYRMRYAPEWSRRPSGWRHGLLSEIETGLAGDSSCRENLLERLPIVRVPAGRQVLGLASGEAAMVKDDPGARAQIEQLEAH